MKQERNNEIDLLLRRLSRPDGNGAREQLGEQHLDTDELSAYAQNALPPAARARYIEHLAECTSCRKLATELSLSLGATTATQVETVPVPGGLKAFLASLFSPLVLRYAVPALGMIVVMVIGFAVLRRQQHSERADLVAQADQQLERVNASNGNPAAPASSATPQVSLDSSPENTAGVVNHLDTAKSAAKPEAKPESGAAATGIATDSIQPVSPASRAVSELQPGAAAPAPAATPATPADVAAQKKLDETEKKPAAVAETVTVTEPTTATNANASVVKKASDNKNENADQNAKAKTGQETRGFYRMGELSGARRREEAKREEADKPAAEERPAKTTKDDAKEKDRDDAETRSVAGRQFRKARGIWIDTAYDSSTATVNMARGSEQFRALVADEPVIGTIAKQLDGEVIVVWKGRAYRIR